MPTTRCSVGWYAESRPSQHFEPPNLRRAGGLGHLLVLRSSSIRFSRFISTVRFGESLTLERQCSC